MLVATLMVLALAALAGCALIPYGGWPLVAIGVSSLLAAYAYTGGPFPLAYHGLGEVCTLVFYGFVAVIGTYIVQARWPAPPAAWMAGSGCGLLATNILLINNIRDMAEDTRAGKRTLVVRIGRKAAQRLYGFNLIFALLMPLLFFAIGSSAFVLLPLLLAPYGHLLYKSLGAAPEGDGRVFNKLLGFSAQLLALWAAFFALGIAF